MKKCLKRIVVLCTACFITSLSSLSVFAYHKTSYERLFAVFTYSAPYATDVTYVSTDVTLPSTTESGVSFYCYQHSGDKTCFCKLSKATLVSGNNAAYLANVGNNPTISLKSNWYTLNNYSQIVEFTASMQSPDLSANNFIGGVAY